MTQRRERFFQSLPVFLSIEIHPLNVIPATHFHTAVDGDGSYRCMGENKTYSWLITESKLRCHRLKVMTIGAEPM